MVVTVVPTLAPLWQVAHPVVMPTWFIAGLGVAKPPAVVLEVEWHVSHTVELGMWFADLNVGGLGTEPWNNWPPWQLEQPDIIPVWLMIQLGAAKLVVLVWQMSH